MAWEPAVSTQGQVPEGSDSCGEQGRNGNVGSLTACYERTLLSEQVHLQTCFCSTNTSVMLLWSLLLPPATGLVCVGP